MSAARTATAAVLNGAMADGGLCLQRCRACATVQYPPRELCRACLGDTLAWTPVDGLATVLACTELQHSLEPFFATRLPWHVASLALDAGPVVFAHLLPGDATPGRRLRVANAIDAEGQWCLFAFDSAGPDAASVLRATLHQLGMPA